MLNQLVISTIRLLSRMASFKARFRLVRALRAPELTQLQLLNQLQRKLKFTTQGQVFKSSQRLDYLSFATTVPCVSYEQIEPLVSEQIRNENKVISPEMPRFYERTSGSGGPAKFIPYTQSYLTILSRLFLIWTDDILRSGINFRSGKTFLCVTPPLSGTKTDSQSGQVGSNTDVDYIAPWLRLIVEHFLVVPLALHAVHDVQTYRDLLSLYLLAAADLEIISLWSPSFWPAMLDHFTEHKKRLLLHLRSGQYQTDLRLWKFAALSQERARLLEAEVISWKDVWPQLRLISCWSEGHASAGAEQLARMFPQSILQGKGLLATEAPVSLPWTPAKGCVPYLTEVFIEGEDQADSVISPLWEWQLDHTYSVIVSLPNGLLRYRLGDLVRVTHFYEKTPVFAFVSRCGQIMDMVGEKLSEEFAVTALRQAAPDLPAVTQFAFFPVQENGISRYVFIHDYEGMDDNFGKRLEAELSQAHHYQLARNLGQLLPLEVGYSATWPGRYFTLAERRGQQLGNIKVALLQKQISSPAEIQFLLHRGES
ncbi:MAG: GH3 auxin-responsive promoter family protein [Chitinophagaceae bacterium]|nr:GH3 auxin-responsive promoter family protein [Oligoflexus sp.]